MKRLTTACFAVCAGAVMAAAGSASAASPTAATSLSIEPQSAIYREVPRPVNLSLTTTVTPEPGAAKMKPMINVKLNFPDGLIYAPDPKKTPPCPLDMFGPTNANFPTDTAIARCGDSLVGNGVSNLFLAQSTSVLITDATVLAFNAGEDAQGHPVMNLHGYSPTLNTGIFMTGTLINGILDVKIPRLTADSAVPSYTIDIPGTMGRDPGYARASCPTGDWASNAVVTLAKRDEAGLFSEVEDLTSPVTHIPCSGLAGKARFSGLKVIGPKSVRSGSRGTFEVTMTNKGTASARKVRVVASGAGEGAGNAGTIRPGASRTITVKAKVKGIKGRKVTVNFKVPGIAGAAGKIGVRVR